MNKRRERALTLVEIMLVLIIIGIVASFVGKKLFGAGDKMKANLTETQLKQIQGYIEQFQLRYSDIPSSLDDLVKCTAQTGQGCIPIANEDVMKDAWGNRFAYQKNGNRYKIKSLGADGKDGGDGVNYDFSIEGP